MEEREEIVKILIREETEDDDSDAEDAKGKPNNGKDSGSKDNQDGRGSSKYLTQAKDLDTSTIQEEYDKFREISDLKSEEQKEYTYEENYEWAYQKLLKCERLSKKQRFITAADSQFKELLSGCEFG